VTSKFSSFLPPLDAVPACQTLRAKRNKEHMCTPESIRSTATATFSSRAHLGLNGQRGLTAKRMCRSFRTAHVSTHCLVVSFCPAAHAFEWCDDCSSESCQGILNSNGLRSRHAACDQPCRFKVAKISGKHTLRDVSEVATQFSVSMRFHLKRKQDFGRPFADKDRGRHFRSLRRLHIDH
jgi:hypothetical protein